MAIWKLRSKRDAAGGKIKKGQSFKVTTIGPNSKPNSFHVQKAYNAGGYSVSCADTNFIMEKLS